MPFDITDCRIIDIHRHPRRSDCTNATVMVRVRERRYQEVSEHQLSIKVRATTDAGMTDEQVRTALLTRAAAILSRTLAAADLRQLPMAAE